MSVDVNEWKIKYDTKILGQVLSFLKTLDQTKILSKSIDGTVHLQTIGNPITKAAIDVFSTLEEKNLFERYNANGAMIEIHYRGTTYYGYVEGNIGWKTVIPYEYYTASINFIIVREE